MIAKKSQIFKLAGVVLTCAVMAACSPSDPTNKTVGNSGTQSAGDADFTKFVAIGDSLTAGYADGALYLLGQQNSFPLMLAQQFAAADGVAVSFTQPLVDDNLGGLVLGGNPMPHPVTGDNMFDTRFALNTATEKPERLQGPATTEVTNVKVGPFSNMGVPGAKSFHLGSNTYGDVTQIGATANPYFVRFASSAGATVIGDAAVQQPSFFVFWIGNNDVLSFATSGGYDDFQLQNAVDQTGNNNPLTYGPNDITDPGLFDATYNGLLATVNIASNKGVLVNIPDVKTIPYFTTVPYNAVPLDQATADVLNSNPNYVGYNAGLQAAVGAAPGFTQAEADARTINFVAGQNAVVIEDEGLFDLTGSGLPSIRHATASDLIVLPAASKIGTEDTPGDQSTVWGVAKALVDADVLVPSEIAAIDTARLAFNTTIKTAADNDPNLAFLDAAAIMKQLSETGVDYGTGTINSEFATGGAFSLDGVHPTARGYAVIANTIVDVINTDFNANVYKVDPATFPAVLLK